MDHSIGFASDMGPLFGGLWDFSLSGIQFPWTGLRYLEGSLMGNGCHEGGHGGLETLARSGGGYPRSAVLPGLVP